MKTNTTPLKKLLAEAESAAADRAELAAQVAALRSQRDVVISEATGPNDAAALQKLNTLAAQESIAANRLALIERRLAGLDPSALNEASHVRATLLDEVKTRRDAVETRVAKSLAPFYETADAARAATSALNFRNQPPELRRLDKCLRPW